MRVLVTGASGFVGRYLCERLAKDHTVRAALQFAEDTKHPGVTESVVIGNIDSKTDWSEALKDVDAVIHLAARVHVMRESAADPLEEFREVNTRGTERLAKACIELGVKRFVFMSTIGINGEGQEGDYAGPGYSETDEPNPRNDYSRSKYEAEQLLFSLSGLEVVSVRAPLIYGHNAPGNFGTLARIIYTGKTLPFKGVKSRRTMIGGQNLADFLTLCVTHPGAVGQVWIATDAEEVTTEDLFRKLSEAAGIQSKLIGFPAGLMGAVLKSVGKGKVYQQLWGSIVVDGSKARRELGWTPPYSLDEGLREAMAPRS